MSMLGYAAILGTQVVLAQLLGGPIMPEQLMMSQMPGAKPVFGGGNPTEVLTSVPHWQSSQDATVCSNVELRSVAGIPPGTDCGDRHVVCAVLDEPKTVIEDLLLCECAEHCLLDRGCTVMEYREERLRAYGLGSQCFLHSSCKATRNHFSDTHCSYTAAVKRGDELESRIHQLHGELGVFPTALHAEAEVLSVQLRLHPPPPIQLPLVQPTQRLEQCEPLWEGIGLPSSWPAESGLVASFDVHFRHTNSSNTTGGNTGRLTDGKCDPSRSLLAIMVPVTSRWTNTSLGLASVPLLQILVPSLLRTLYLSGSTATSPNVTVENHNHKTSAQLNYVLMIGFDEDDPLWDSPMTHWKLPELVHAAANHLISHAFSHDEHTNRSTVPALHNWPRLSVMLHRCSGDESGSMVRATNCIARRAFEIGAEWSYRLNDDSWLQTPNWGVALTDALTEQSRSVLQIVASTVKNTNINATVVKRSADRRLHVQAWRRQPVLGVVGPFCPDGKQWTEGGQVLLVMDLVHRTHYEIFGFHYDPVFSNWWCDDWISLVYEDTNHNLAYRVGKDTVLVRHFIGEGEGGHQAETRTARYSVDFTHEAKLWKAVEEGRQRISEWLAQNSVAK